MYVLHRLGTLSDIVPHAARDHVRSKTLDEIVTTFIRVWRPLAQSEANEYRQLQSLDAAFGMLHSVPGCRSQNGIRTSGEFRARSFRSRKALADLPRRNRPRRELRGAP
jgi:hypothetical protein